MVRVWDILWATFYNLIVFVQGKELQIWEPDLCSSILDLLLIGQVDLIFCPRDLAFLVQMERLSGLS